MDNGKIYSSKQDLLTFLNIKENFLYKDFSQKYKEKQLPKKNGGVRQIKPPNPNLKKLQRLILDKILSKNPQILICHVYMVYPKKKQYLQMQKSIKKMRINNY